MRTFGEGEDGIDFSSYLSDLKTLAPKIKVAYVEKVHAIYGSSASSTFTFGRNYQAALCGLEASDIPYRLVAPKDWQKTVLCKKNKIFKNKNKVDTKAMAREAAKVIFKDESFLKTPRSKTPHDGLVDAALIATYGLRKEKGEA